MGRKKRHMTGQNMKLLLAGEKGIHFPQLSIIPLYIQVPWKGQKNWGKYLYF